MPGSIDMASRPELRVPAEPLDIDGAHGEGGGQILRSALTLSVITGRHLRIHNMRAARKNPGLAAQHLTAVRAAAALCQAALAGDSLGSQELDFAPAAPVKAGEFEFDVAEARTGGSAGSVNLVLQTVLLPLALVSGESRVELRGGTHLPMSPSFDYVRDVWLPTLARIGITASVELDAWGWYPIGRGRVRAAILGTDQHGRWLAPLECPEHGALRRVSGRAVAANLPSHIPQRMSDRARTLLEPLGVEVSIEAERVRAYSPGAGIFLVAEYESIRCGFSALGLVGKPSEVVAEEAVGLLMKHHASGAALERHLADQILVPLSLARRPSTFTVEEVTSHLRTNAWVIEQFGLSQTRIVEATAGTATVTLSPAQGD
jgi:RNA 3'-terminal phosphate cyclase (ATP)